MIVMKYGWIWGYDDCDEMWMIWGYDDCDEMWMIWGYDEVHIRGSISVTDGEFELNEHE